MIIQFFIYLRAKLNSQWHITESPKLLLALASTMIFGSESHGTHDHILLSGGSWESLMTAFRDRQSQNYFTTGGLPPISSSWWQAP
jgi:hypothetical protein